MATKQTTKKKPTSKVVAHAAAAHAKTRAVAGKVVKKGPGRALAGFVTFIREKGVVGLAVGLAIGTAATGLVTQIVSAVITPLVGLLLGKDGISSLDFTVTIGSRSETFLIGALLDALIKFMAVAAVIYFVVIGLKLDRLDKKADK
jgi:large conductance mechanosensitive channel